MDGVKHVYQAISDVAGDLAKEGIAKDRKNQQQGYQFRGIDDVYNALAPSLAKHGLCILPNVCSREITERESSKGGALFYVVVKVDFAFVSAKDGSEHHVVTYGEAMDSADKATNKAMSAAYKYAAMQAFCIPTEGDNDADATTHDVRSSPRQPPDEKSPPPPAQNTKPQGGQCPKCGGPMWDNRAKKTNPKAPDFKCKATGCDGVIWPPREHREPDPPLSGTFDPNDDVPF